MNSPLIMDRLVILDPLNNQNNVGRCTFNINEIKVKLKIILNKMIYFEKSFWIAIQILHQNYNCPENSLENHSLITNFIKQKDICQEKIIPSEETHKEKNSPCCLLKRFFQLPTQFSQKGYKLNNEISFTLEK